MSSRHTAGEEVSWTTSTSSWIKYEKAYLKAYAADRDARAGIGRRTEFYYHRRPVHLNRYPSGLQLAGERGAGELAFR
jgi:hypothetical protein